jgi:hypothetical protein
VKESKGPHSHPERSEHLTGARVVAKLRAGWWNGLARFRNSVKSFLSRGNDIFRVPVSIKESCAF